MVFEMVNPGYQSLFGNLELVGKPFLEAIPEFKDQCFIELLRKVLETGEPYTGVEILARHRTSPDGPIEDRYYDFTYVRVVDGEGRPYGVYDHAIDVTDRVLMKKKLLATVSELEAERENRDRFVATLTHDLRTPLTAAKMSAQLLARKSSDAFTVQRVSHRIVDLMDRIDRMIRDLLDANRIKAGESIALKLEACNLNEVVSDVIDELSTVHGDRFILSRDEECQGTWDNLALRRVTENLCNNAVKYGDAHAPIHVALRRMGEMCQLSVHNEGSLISAEDQESLFKLFRRTNSAEAGAQKGWGLGLALVRGIAEAHNGRVYVESRPCEGTTFTVELPVLPGSK